MLKNESMQTEYPRPQFERKSWMCLNGIWDFEFDDNNMGEKEHWFDQTSLQNKIKVPFVYESRASGIGITEQHENVWYHRTFRIPKLQAGKHVLLNFQGVDYRAKVWINGRLAGQHVGANTAFDMDITDYVKLDGDNQITVKAEDGESCYQPRGKQRWMDHNFLCWYTQSTGIWKTVWLEFVSQTRLQKVKITSDIDHACVKFEYLFHRINPSEKLILKTQITCNGNHIQEFTFAVSRETMEYTVNIIDDAITQKIFLWTPDKPDLYQVKFTLTKSGCVIDEVISYFGMRKISTGNGKIYLNNQEIYQKLVLEQGFWPETLLTPPSDEAICKEIDCIRDMGFNGVRIHQKVEDERFLYFCDQRGLLVWSEMSAAYAFSDEAVMDFVKEWMQIVEQQYNHPSIIVWTPFNESWGIPNVRCDPRQQSFTETIYYLTKSLDPMRPVITNDGWEHTISDIITIHDYGGNARSFFEKYRDENCALQKDASSGSGRRLFADGFHYSGQPVIFSEFGGIALKEMQENAQSWGYGEKAVDAKEFIQRYAEMLSAIKDIKYVAGYCYTQLTDVQQEQNGLYTETRVAKIASDEIKKINSDHSHMKGFIF
jgi:beta-galactosidase/beta-glucuronidase